jgi:hypothetical protein
MPGHLWPGTEMNKSATPPKPPTTAADVEVFARNLARMVEEGGKALAAYM